jgi:hypothetical protein
MDRETIIKLAREAGVEWCGVHMETEVENAVWKGDIERLIKLAAEHEREACAKVADEVEYCGACPSDVAKAIRARGNNA